MNILNEYEPYLSEDADTARKSLGQLGEEYACEYLKEQGYIILRRNFRHHRYGEIDIIASKAGAICFIEVKTRTSELYGIPQEAITLAKQRKIYRCAEYYLQQEGLLRRMPMLSFDVVCIWVKGRAVCKLEHFPHAF